MDSKNSRQVGAHGGARSRWVKANGGNGTPAGSLATPLEPNGILSFLLSGPTVPALVARLGARVAAWFGDPIRFGNTVVVARHANVMNVLHRDLDFLIAPVNEKRIVEVNGPFVLGMDRGATLVHERSALYQSLGEVDFALIRRGVEEEANRHIASASDEIDVVDGYARPIAAQTATALFGIRGTDERTFMDVARAIFGHVFLNLSGDEDVRQRALKAAVLMETWFKDEIKRRRASGDLGSDMMGALMKAQTLDDNGIRRTLGGMLVGSIDTTASSVAKIIAMIAKDRELLKNIAADVDDDVRLAGWCREALRRWPHNPILLRQAAASTSLADVEIKKGDRVFAWTQAAMLDAEVFPDPRHLRPDRPVAAYLHFGAGLHPCAGRAVNAFQIPALVGALVRRGIKSTGTVRWAGPFPAHLPLHFER
jgi:cytochrome P450